MKFVIASINQAKAHGIEIIPTMRQSVDMTQVVLHEEYVKNIDEFNVLTRYEFDSPEFTELMNSEAWTHGEDYVQPNEDYAKVRAMQILTAETKANINTMKMSNTEALSVKEFYPEWSADSVQVKQGEKYQYNEKLYEVVQDHITQSNWSPENQSSLWVEVVEDHEGTLEDPIPYNEELNPMWQGMILEGRPCKWWICSKSRSMKVFNYFGYDGLKHVIASNVMVVVLNLILPLWVAVLVAALAGVGKEVVWDKLMKKGTFDKKDLIADAVGIIIGCL